MEKEKKKNSFLRKLKHKYRLVLMRDDTFEEKLSFRLSRLNVFIVMGAIVILLIVITTYIIAFTPLREYIPGYGSSDANRSLRELTLKADSLEEDLNNKNLYLLNIRNVMEGKEIVDKLPGKPDSTGINYSKIEIKRLKEDSLLRLEMEKQDQNPIAVGE